MSELTLFEASKKVNVTIAALNMAVQAGKLRTTMRGKGETDRALHYVDEADLLHYVKEVRAKDVEAPTHVKETGEEQGEIPSALRLIEIRREAARLEVDPEELY